MKIPKIKLPSVNSAVGIDLGSTRIRVGTFSAENLITYSEANCLAIEDSSKKILEFGDEALKMKKRVKESILILEPIRRGVVYDDEQVQILSKLILEKYGLFSVLGNSRYMVTVPTDATHVEKQLVLDVFYALGAREVFTISQALAASIGAGVPIADSTGSFLFHIGHSWAEAVVISLGSVVAYKTSTKAGQSLLSAIQKWFRETEQLYISEETVQQILASIHQKNVVVLGQDLTKKNPKELAFQPSRVNPLISNFMELWSVQFKELISSVPPQLTADILDKGLLLSGNMASLPDLSEYLVQSLGVPVSVVEDPQEAAIKGVCIALKHVNEFKRSLGYIQ